MIKKSVILVVLALLLSLSLVAAAEISVTQTGEDFVEVGGDITFNLEVENTGSEFVTLQLTPEAFASLPSSPIAIFSIQPKIIELAGHDSVDVTVALKMKETVLPKENYATYVKLEDIYDLDWSMQHNLIMSIIPPDEVVSVSAVVPDRVSPNSEFEVVVDFKNNMNFQLSDVEVYVGSELFEEQKTMILFPLQERSATFKFKVPSMAKPEDYALSVRVYHKGVLNGKSSDSFTVTENSDVRQEVTVNQIFLGEEVTVTKTNLGNAVMTEYYDYPVSVFARMFVKASIDPSVDSAGYHWMFELGPGELVTLEVRKCYLPLLFLIAAILLFVFVAYYLLTRGLIVRKKVFKLKKSHGQARFTVMLHIKNRTRGVVKDVTVFEILPGFIKPSTSFGVLKPHSEQKGEQGVKLTWKMAELIKGEERIISYQVDSKIGIIGSVALPHCLVRYKNRAHKVVNVKSNAITLELGSETK